jgi:phosphoserine phosphatase RsbU/P
VDGNRSNDWSVLVEDGWHVAPERALRELKRHLLGEEEFDEAQLSALSGVEPATVRRLWRAMGFASVESKLRTFTQADVIALRSVEPMLAWRGEQSVLEEARVLSALFARAADVVAKALVGDVEHAQRTSVPSPGFSSIVEQLPVTSALLDYLFRRQFVTEFARNVTADAEKVDVSGARPLAVVFADLVGFTPLSEQLEDDELAALVSRFQSVAFDLVAEKGGRVVKTLGDEVMVVAEELGTAFEIATTLASGYARDEHLPDARVGMAYGPVLVAQGDFFGPTVNLASRLVAIAPPGMVVVSDEVRLALDPETRSGLTQFGPRRLKGIGWTTSWVVEPSLSDGKMARPALEDFYSALLDDDAEELYERAPCGYLSTTPEGTIIKVNQTFLTWTGHQRAELVGRRQFIELLTAGGRIYHETHYAPMLHTQGTAREIAFELLTADGRRLPCLVNAVLERDATGAPIVIRIAIFDATDRREYERELLRAKQRAEESDNAATLLARTLQQTLIPPALPEIPGLDLAAAYRPAGRGEEVGGDFYDVFEIGDGDWVVVIGDVRGKGAEAAVVTALARYTIRAAAAQQRSPSDFLATLNDALTRHGTGRFCTVAAARFTKLAARWHVTVCSAGHPLPLLVRGGASPRPAGEYGTLLGVFDSPLLRDCALTFDAGDHLVFFTDGVTEARLGRDFYGDDRLRAAAAGRASAQDLVDRILDDVLQFQEGVSADDIAILVVRGSEVDD